MLLLALLLLQATAPTSDRAEAERLFALGRQLHAEGDAAGAVAAFEGARATGWTSAALAYDLGTACLDTGDLGCAVLHLTRAHRADPGDTRIRHNLRIARERAGLPAEPVRSPLGALGAALGRTTLLLLGYVLFLTALAGLGYRIWTRRPDAWLRRALVAGVPLAGLVLGLGLAVWLDGRAPEAVVLTEAPLAWRPGTTEGPRLAPGQFVRLGAVQGGWVEARLPDGAEGWVALRALGTL